MPRWWETFIVVLTLASVLLVLFEWGLETKGEIARLRSYLGWADIALCTFFLFDFGVRLWRSESRREFLKRNWLELLGAVPLLGPLRAMRLVRLARIVRLWRGSEGLRQRFSITFPQEIGNLGTAVVVVWVLTAIAMYLFERGVNEHIEGLDDALWWSIVTLSTVGYGDISPVTHAGRLVAILTMVVGVGVLGTLAATIATALIDLRDRARRGLRSWNMKEHLLVLGWNAKAEGALEDFRLDPRYREMPIVVVADLAESPVEDPTIRFVRGNPSRREVLDRASAAAASAAMVLADDPTDLRSDHHTALVVLGLRRLSQTIKIGAELVDSDNKEQFEEVGCDAVIDFGHLGAMLLVRGIQDVGVTEVVEDLLSNRDGSELFRVVVPEGFVGKTWRDLAVAMIDHDVAPIGLERGNKRLLNPARDTVLEATDFLFVVAKDPP